MRLIRLVLALSLILAPLAVEGQQAGKVYRLGYLAMDPVLGGNSLDSFRQGLRDLGYLEGRDFVLEIRYAEEKLERLPDLAAELVRSQVDLIVTQTGSAAVAVKEATQTIPIVMMSSGDAVRQGLVVSLARPGGNVTGFTMINPELSRKRLELLREMLPKLSHVGVLWCCGAVGKQEWVETQTAADVLGVRLSSLEVAGREDLGKAFASAAKQRVQAVLVFDRQNLFIEQRFAEGKLDRLPGLARELTQLRVDALVAASPPAIRAAKDATSTIPIVMLLSYSDPVELGFVASFARPGSNITGVVLAAEPTMAGKRLELIKEVVPRAARIAVLATGEAQSRTQVRWAEKVAPSLRVKLVVVESRKRRL